jgi:hypothetical protein
MYLRVYSFFICFRSYLLDSLFTKVLYVATLLNIALWLKQKANVSPDLKQNLVSQASFRFETLASTRELNTPFQN